MREVEILTSLKDRFEDVVEEGLMGVDTDAVDAFDSNKGIVEALEMAIKSLEQESVIDKIRAEIEEEMLIHSGTGEEVIQAYVDGLNKGLQTIDKYKVERSGE